ncbi:MAG: hypothetical protein ACF8QF_10690 [Phycisphaerales bacterium]
MHKRDLNEGRTGTLLTGLGLLTAAGIVALSFAGDAAGDTGLAAQAERQTAAATVGSPQTTRTLAGFID